MIPACHCAHLENAHTGGCQHCACERFEDATGPHTAHLRDIADTGLVIAKKDLERIGTVTPFFVLYAGGESHQINIPERFTQLMNDGHAKDMIFGFLRQAVQKTEATAVVIVTDGWFGKPTAKAMAMGEKEASEAMEGQSLDNAEEAGLVERLEALLITVQTPERCLTLAQAYERDHRRQKIKYLEVHILECDINHFAGRQKMFGDLRPENIT